MTLHRFPFDAQVLEAKLISFGDYNDRVLLAVDERILGAPEEFSEPDKKVNIAQWILPVVYFAGLIISHLYYEQAF